MNEHRTVTQTITPLMAKSMLSNNKSNRAVSKQDVLRYSRDMKAGKWMLTHQGILVGKDGALIDGQHRLMAIVKSGVTVKMPVTYDESITTPLELPMDTGRKRSAFVSLGIPTQLSSVSNLAYKIANSGSIPTLSELKQVVDLVQPIYDLFPKTTRKGITSAVMLAAIVQIMRGLDQDYIIETYDGLVGDYKKLSPCAASFFCQLVIDRTRMDTHELLARGVRIFDPANKYKTKSVIVNREFAIQEAVSMTKEVILTDRPV